MFSSGVVSTSRKSMDVTSIVGEVGAIMRDMAPVVGYDVWIGSHAVYEN